MFNNLNLVFYVIETITSMKINCFSRGEGRWEEVTRKISIEEGTAEGGELP